MRNITRLFSVLSLLITFINSFDSSTENLIKEYYDNDYKLEINSEVSSSLSDTDNGVKYEEILKNPESKTVIDNQTNIKKDKTDSDLNKNKNINENNNNVKISENDKTNEDPVIKVDIKEMREEYSYWIRFKNSFTFNQDQKAKLARSFKPEDKNYYINSCNIVWFVYILVGILSLSLLVYLIGRFAFGKFLGPKQVIGKWYAKGYIITLFLFFVSYTAFISVSFYYYNQTNFALNSIADFNIYNSTKVEQMSYSSIKLKEMEENKLNLDGIVKNLDGHKVVNDNLLAKVNDSIQFKKDFLIYNYQYKAFMLSFLIIIPTLVIISVVFYCLKKEKILIVTSILIFAFSIPMTVLSIIDTGYTMMHIDFCSEIYKINTKEQTSQLSGKGLAYYSSCVNKESLMTLSVQRYSLMNSFNLVYNKLNELLKEHEQKLPTNKQDTEAYNKLLEIFKDNVEISEGIKLLLIYNETIAIIEPISTCKSFHQRSEKTEENYCYLNLTKEFRVKLFMLLAILSLIPLSIAVNKLIVVIAPYIEKGKDSSDLQKTLLSNHTKTMKTY